MALDGLLLSQNDKTARPPVEMITPRVGLVYKMRDKSGGKVFVNVVSHELVQKPLDASMQEVSDEHLEFRGIANLRVPLDVGEPFTVKDKAGDPAVAVDVILNPGVVERTIQGRMAEYYQREVAGLLVRNVQDELVSAGKGKGLELAGWKLLKNAKYKGGEGPKPFPWVDPTWGKRGEGEARKKNSKMSGASEGLVGPLGEAIRSEDSSHAREVVVEEKLGEGELEEVCSRRTGERSGGPTVKKGFLEGKGGKLYANEDGSYGSREQSGPKYDHVEQSLKHLPEGLRSKCAVVDTTKMSQDEVKDAMAQYADTGRVVTGPAAPKANQHMSQRQFDGLFKKAGAEAPEPTFALKLPSSAPSKTAILELPHVIASLPQGAAIPEALSLTVTLPPEITSMAELDVEVSSRKVEVKSKDGRHALNLGWPLPVDPDAASAKHKKKLAQLLIVVPVAPQPQPA